MSTLYRKYRPTRFSQVIGHESVVSLIRNEVVLDTPSHAYLFSGVRGVGKTTFARLIARALNCKERAKIDKKGSGVGKVVEGAVGKALGRKIANKGNGNKTADVFPGDPCGKCDACLDIEKGVFPDVVEIDAASHRGIDEIRSLKERIAFAPMRGRYKIYIVDEAHMLTREAFNALLKTLEEPPEHVVFILCTTEPHKLPETIISRCQWFELKLATPEQLSTKLKEIAKAEKVKVEEEVFALVAPVAGGSFRDGESLFGSLLSAIEKGKPVDLALARKILNIPGKAAISRLFRLIIEGNAVEARVRLDKLKERGYGADKLIDSLIENGSDRLFDVVSKEEIERVIKLQHALIEAKRDVGYLPDPFIALELIVVEFKKDMADGGDGGWQLNNDSASSGVSKNEAIAKTLTISTKTVAAKKAFKTEVTKDALETINNKKEWSDALLAVEKSGCQLATILSYSSIVLVGDTLKVVVKNTFELGVVSAPKNQALLRRELGVHMPDVRGIICEVGTAEEIGEKELGSIFT